MYLILTTGEIVIAYEVVNERFSLQYFFLNNYDKNFYVFHCNIHLKEHLKKLTAHINIFFKSLILFLNIDIFSLFLHIT